MPASEQLERLLYILPVAAREGGVPADELARALGVSRETVLHDLEQATARAYYHPAGFVEEFSIYIEGDVVSVHCPAEFKRPARLSPREALALGLGLRALAAEADAERRAEILAFAERVERDLATPLHEMQPLQQLTFEVRQAPPMPSAPAMVRDEPVEIVMGEDELRGALNDAIVARRVCRISYLSPTAREPVDREIKPVRLIHASAHWYVAALIAGSDEARMYRLDRILHMRVTDKVFKPVTVDVPAEFTPRGEPAEVRVRYSPRIARWIAEQHDDVVVAADGQEAWHLLLETGADLVVSDVEMPRMDGFMLTEAIRASRQFRDLPVVLVTAMESEADKARGLAVGANAYRVKSAFDQTDLLATIERIL